MTLIWDNVIGMAINEANKSYIRFRHGAVIIYRGRIVAKGYNKQKSVRNILKHHKIFNGNKSVHAEIDAIFDLVKNGFNVNILKYCTMIVVRLPGSGYIDIKNTSECLYSKPCQKCSKILIKLGLNKIYHS